MQQRVTVPVQIASGTALSAEVNINAGRIIGIQMPAGWDAAGLSIQALLRQPAGNPPAPVFGEVIDNAGAELVLAAAPAANEYVALQDTLPLKALGRVKVRSGTAALPVNQTATRDFFLVILVD